MSYKFTALVHSIHPSILLGHRLPAITLVFHQHSTLQSSSQPTIPNYTFALCPLERSIDHHIFLPLPLSALLATLNQLPHDSVPPCVDLVEAAAFLDVSEVALRSQS